MLLNEPNPNLRILAARILDGSGNGLASSYVWSTGEVKVSKGGGAFVNAVNLPTFPSGASAGSWNLQLAADEVDTEGPLRVQFSPSGGQFVEYVDEVRAAIAAVAPSTSDIVAALQAMVTDPDAPVNARTFLEQWNILVAYAAAGGTGLDGPVGVIKSLDGATDRIAFRVQSGVRTITSRDGR